MPSTRISPWLGRIKPVMRFISVVLPLPLGPTTGDRSRVISLRFRTGRQWEELFGPAELLRKSTTTERFRSQDVYVLILARELVENITTGCAKRRSCSIPHWK